MKTKNESFFSGFHPIALFLYFVIVILFTVFTRNPIILFSALLGNALFLASVNGIFSLLKELRFYIPFFIIITVTNPLFSHNGKTPLFFMNDNPVTLEAIIYGADTALAICAVLFVCKSFNRVMDTEKLLCVFGVFSPKISVVLSMSFRFIPLFKEKWHEIKDAETAMGYFSAKGAVNGIISGARVFSSLVTWALENAVITAHSMRSRGFMLHGRKRFSVFRFRTADFMMIAVCAVMSFAVAVGYFSGKTDFYFYPEITAPSFGAVQSATYIAFAILSFLPFIFEVKEALLWKYSISKI